MLVIPPHLFPRSISTRVGQLVCGVLPGHCSVKRLGSSELADVLFTRHKKVSIITISIVVRGQVLRGQKIRLPCSLLVDSQHPDCLLTDRHNSLTKVHASNLNKTLNLNVVCYLSKRVNIGIIIHGIRLVFTSGTIDQRDSSFASRQCIR